MYKFTLKQIQQKLNVPQHVLIHLCEKGVIEPEIAETKGRGQWREFSQRNLFEFAVALALRDYQIPVVVVRAVIKLLISFERNARKIKSNFELPASIIKPNPELLLFVEKGETVIIGGKGIVFSYDLGEVLETGKIKLQKLKDLPIDSQNCLKINLSEIAEKITKED